MKTEINLTRLELQSIIYNHLSNELKGLMGEVDVSMEFYGGDGSEIIAPAVVAVLTTVPNLETQVEAYQPVDVLAPQPAEAAGDYAGPPTGLSHELETEEPQDAEALERLRRKGKPETPTPAPRAPEPDDATRLSRLRELAGSTEEDNEPITTD